MMRTLKRFLLAVPGFEAACRLLTRRRVRVLMYHRFTGDPATGTARFPVAEFAKQLDYIARHHEVWDCERHARYAGDGRDAGSRPPVVITVDDGYRDFHVFAYPALRQRGLTATLFVTTGFVDGRTWMWWDKVRYILGETTRPSVRLDLGARTVEGPTATDRDRRALWSAIVPPLRFVPDERKEDLVAQLARESGVTLPATAPDDFAASSWEDLQEMARDGISIGAHTMSHPILSRVTEEQARKEISGSIAELAEHELPVAPWFAYPQGGPADITPGIMSLTEDIGFSGAYVAYDDPSHRLPFARPRQNAPRDLVELRWLCCGAEILGQRLRVRLGLRTDVGRGYWQGYGDAD